MKNLKFHIGLRRSRKKRRSTPGEAPGTLVPDPHAVHPDVGVIAYGPEALHEGEIGDIEDIKATLGRYPVTWVNVDGLADHDLILQLGSIFDLHPLALEDVVNTHQRPKVDEYENNVLIVTRMAPVVGEHGTEQIAIFLGANFVVTFQERPGDCFEPVRERIRHGRGRIRDAGVDYLAYALLDITVDGYFPALEKYSDILEDLEVQVLDEPDVAVVGRIHTLKRELLEFKHAIWPQRDLFSVLIRDPMDLISDQTTVYLRDCYDHTVQLMDLTETHRETASGLLDTYHSSISTRMNEIMKVLTIIATIFIPLSFIAGVYGMNFDPEKSPWNLPELSRYYDYPYALGLMAASGYYAMAKDQLRRFRDAVVADATGEEIASLVGDATRRGYEIGSIGELKTAPRGYDRDHPRIELIRRKGLMLSKDFGAPKWLHTKQAERRIRDCWDGAAEVCAWLDAHVGPSTEPPGDRPF